MRGGFDRLDVVQPDGRNRVVGVRRHCGPCFFQLEDRDEIVSRLEVAVDARFGTLVQRFSAVWSLHELESCLSLRLYHRIFASPRPPVLILVHLIVIGTQSGFDSMLRPHGILSTAGA